MDRFRLKLVQKYKEELTRAQIKLAEEYFRGLHGAIQENIQKDFESGHFSEEFYQAAKMDFGFQGTTYYKGDNNGEYSYEFSLVIFGSKYELQRILELLRKNVSVFIQEMEVNYHKFSDSFHSHLVSDWCRFLIEQIIRRQKQFPPPPPSRFKLIQRKIHHFFRHPPSERETLHLPNNNWKSQDNYGEELEDNNLDEEKNEGQWGESHTSEEEEEEPTNFIEFSGTGRTETESRNIEAIELVKTFLDQQNYSISKEEYNIFNSDYGDSIDEIYAESRTSTIFIQIVPSMDNAIAIRRLEEDNFLDLRSKADYILIIGITKDSLEKRLFRDRYAPNLYFISEVALRELVRREDDLKGMIIFDFSFCDFHFLGIFYSELTSLRFIKSDSFYQNDGFNFLENFRSIEELWFSECNIPSIDLSKVYHPKLKSLDFSNNRLKEIDLFPLSQCRNLERLDLEGNRIVSIDLLPLSRCAHLNNLILNDNCLTQLDLTPLAQIRDLKLLYLSNNLLSTIDLTPLTKTAKIDTLLLNNNKLTELDLTPLAQISALKSLYLSNNLLSTIDLTPLTKTAKIEDLALDGNKLTELDLTPLTNCNSLSELYLEGNQLNEISLTPLSQCKNLDIIYLDSNTPLYLTDSLIPDYEEKGLPEAIMRLIDDDRVSWRAEEVHLFEQTSQILPPFHCQICSEKHPAGTIRMLCEECGRAVCIEAFEQMVMVNQENCPMCSADQWRKM